MRLFGGSVLLIAAAALALTGCAGFLGAPRFIPVSDGLAEPGPQSRTTVFGGLLFTAGVSPINPRIGEFLPGDITAQTHRVLDNLDAILKRSGCTMDDVVHVSVYMADVKDEAKMFEVVAARFLGPRPALTTVPGRRLYGSALLEVDFVARLP
jgi:2-iminobutanoate/2-iminopropanoate deaminase